MRKARGHSTVALCCAPPILLPLLLRPALGPATDILQYHLVLGESLRARDIEEGETEVETALGKDITVVKKGKDISIKLVRGPWCRVCEPHSDSPPLGMPVKGDKGGQHQAVAGPGLGCVTQICGAAWCLQCRVGSGNEAWQMEHRPATTPAC